MAGAIPLFGKAFKGGKIILKNIDDLDEVPNKFPDEIDFPKFEEGKTAAWADGEFTLSGYSADVPPGFSRPILSAVAKEFPMNRTPSFKDNNAGDGAFWLSHAEKQVQTLRPGKPIVSTRDMCDHCFQDFTELARLNSQNYYVLDPSGLYVFKP
ncbi:hypothetical protein [Streptomyces sannanensis]|uniref:hypothetical protein n=1 Tax=Streptomyces sannanensis TaxID=285536 RepID=UPI0031EF9723